MNTFKLFAILTIVALVGFSCTYFSDDKQEVTKLYSNDSLHALANDSIKALKVNKDTLTDTAFAINGIDTKKIHPIQVVEFAEKQIGIPYKYGSTDPSQGFDCSGFITYVFDHFGIEVPRSSIDFTNVGIPVALEDSKYGDLILFTGTDNTKRFVGHMGLIVKNENGNVEFIHSTSGRQYGVTITPFNDYYNSRYIKTIRIFPNSSW